MGTVRKTITLTDKQDAWVKERIANGDYANDSEYIRALVRRDQESGVELAALRNAIHEGLNSGVSERTVEEIWSEAEKRYESRNG
jgi:antitoxin ParD1/3/4